MFMRSSCLIDDVNFSILGCGVVIGLIAALILPAPFLDSSMLCKIPSGLLNSLVPIAAIQEPVYARIRCGEPNVDVVSSAGACPTRRAAQS